MSLNPKVSVFSALARILVYTFIGLFRERGQFGQSSPSLIRYVTVCAGLMLAIAWLPLSASGQTGSIAGTVTDAQNGEPLPGVNVIVIGLDQQGIGAATDEDGQYTISAVPTGEHTVEARFVGYEVTSRQVTVERGQTVGLNFQLNRQLLNLDEVVVTGVGEATSRRRIGINVESVNSQSLLEVPAPDIGSALAGKIAGANITQSSGQPGVAPSITLRGINTLGQTTPMVLVDGVEISTANSFAGTDINVSSRLSDFDFSDAKRVEVVKGAASSTIYGAQGANGVIQIFTKTGNPDETRISFSSSLQWSEHLGDVEKAENHFFQTEDDGTIAGLTRDSETGQWTVPNVDIGPETENGNPFVEDTFDPISAVLQSSLTQQYDLSVSGGVDGFTYYLSGNRLDQEGVQRATSQERNSVRANFSADVLEDLRIDVRTNFLDVQGESTESGNTDDASPIATALFTPQFVNLEQPDANGNIVAVPVNQDTQENPLFIFEHVAKNTETTRFITGINVEYTPLEWLELHYDAGVDHFRYEFDEIQDNVSDNPIATLDPLEGFRQRLAEKATNVTSTLTTFLRVGLTENLSSSTQLAFDLRRRTLDRTDSRGQGLPPSGSQTLRAASDPSVDQFVSEFNTYGFLINEKLEYREQLGVTFGGRFDYSSAFGEGQDASFFPRGDVFVRLSEFDFWNSLPRAMSELKLRAAYGAAGIQPGAFDRILTLGQGQIGGSGTLLPRNTLPNRELTVEESQEFEVGLDADVQGGDRLFPIIKTSVTYWDRTTDNVIQELATAPSTGAASRLDNGLSIEASGFDVSLDAVALKTSGFQWDMGVNFGKATSKVGSISNGEDIILQEQFLLREGEEVGSHFGQKGVRSLNERVVPGNPDSDLILDANGDGQVTEADGNFVFVDGKVVDADSRSVVFRPYKEKLGDASPDFTVSFLNDFDFGGLVSLGFQIDWIQGPDIYNQTKQWLYRDNLHADFDQEVTIGENRGAFVTYYRSIYNTNDNNEFFVEDGSFVRLREAHLNFNLVPLLKSIGVGVGLEQHVRTFQLRLTGRNLLTLTDYTGFDPEVSANGADSRVRGLDDFTFPNFRTFTFGMNVQF
jgi:TonB-linked SusC/RagA family outer membrane protein